MKAHEAISELVRRGGHGSVFGVLGAGNAAWVGHGVREGHFTFVKARHEETAVDAAAAFAEATGRIGVATVARGPGFANSINALATSARAHYPVVMIVTESPTLNSTRQQINQRGLAEIVGASFHQVGRPEDLETKYWEALADAQWGGRTQVLSIADLVFEHQVTLSDEAVKDFLPPKYDATDAETIRHATTVLHGAKRPLILAGQGAVVADCRSELEELASLAGARLATTLIANRFFSGHPHDLGICGSWSGPLSREVVMDADVVLAFGASLNKDTTASGTAFGSATVIHCEVDPDRPCFSSSPELALLGDARDAARAMIAAWRELEFEQKPAPTAYPTWNDNRQALLEADTGHSPDRGLDPRRVVDWAHRRLSPDRVVVVDSGRNCGGPLYSLIDVQDTRSWIVSNAFGSIGRGLGYAVGAAAAHPGRPVVLFCGDGGFMMASQSLDAVKINGLDLLVVIFNDEQYASDSQHLTVHGLPLDVVSQPLPDIPKLAAAYGGKGFTVRTMADLESLDLPNGGLTLIDARVDPASNVRMALG